MEVFIVPDDFSTIQSAVTAANPGDVVFVKNGVYHEEVVVDNDAIRLITQSPRAVLDGQNTLGTIQPLYWQF